MSRTLSLPSPEDTREMNMERFVRALKESITEDVIFDVYHSQHALLQLSGLLATFVGYLDAEDGAEAERQLLATLFHLEGPNYFELRRRPKPAATWRDWNAPGYTPDREEGAPCSPLATPAG